MISFQFFIALTINDLSYVADVVEAKKYQMSFFVCYPFYRLRGNIESFEKNIKVYLLKDFYKLILQENTYVPRGFLASVTTFCME